MVISEKPVNTSGYTLVESTQRISFVKLCLCEYQAVIVYTLFVGLPRMWGAPALASLSGLLVHLKSSLQLFAPPCDILVPRHCPFLRLIPPNRNALPERIIYDAVPTSLPDCAVHRLDLGPSLFRDNIRQIGRGQCTGVVESKGSSKRRWRCECDINAVRANVPVEVVLSVFKLCKQRDADGWISKAKRSCG